MNVIQVGANNRDHFYVLTDIGEVLTFTIHDVSRESSKFTKIDFELGVKEKIIMIAPSDYGVFALTNFGKIVTYLAKNGNSFNRYEKQIFNPMVTLDASKIVKISSGGHDSLILERG